ASHPMPAPDPPHAPLPPDCPPYLRDPLRTGLLAGGRGQADAAPGRLLREAGRVRADDSPAAEHLVRREGPHVGPALPAISQPLGPEAGQAGPVSAHRLGPRAGAAAEGAQGARPHYYLL